MAAEPEHEHQPHQPHRPHRRTDPQPVPTRPTLRVVPEDENDPLLTAEPEPLPASPLGWFLALDGEAKLAFAMLGLALVVGAKAVVALAHPGHLPWWGVVAILGAGLLWAGKLHEGRAGGSCCGGSSKGVRAWLKSGGPFSTRHTAVHEAGHAGVAVAQGKGFNAEVYGPSEGGWCGIGQWWRDPIDSIAFLLGGQVAAGRSLGDWGDNDKIKAFLRGFPEDARAGALAEAYRRCARGLAATSGLRERVAERLRTTGKASG